MQLNYQDGSYPQFNGNISNQRWGNASGSYQYDANGNATTDGRTGVVLGYNWLGNEYDPRDSLKDMEKNYKSLGLKRTVYKKGSITVTTLEPDKRERKKEEKKKSNQNIMKTIVTVLVSLFLGVVIGFFLSKKISFEKPTYVKLKSDYSHPELGTIKKECF